MIERNGFLLIDTETSALMKFDLPADHPGQGRLAHLAMIECGPAPDFEVTRKVDFYVKPDGWSMTAGATAVNGLTNIFLWEQGIPIGEVLDAYAASILSGRSVVAFGAQFDCKVMRGELRWAGRDDLFEKTPNICLMRNMTRVCNLPQKKGKGLKWPKLEEAMQHYELPFEVTHTATNDVLAVHQLLCRINEEGELWEPTIHYSRNHAEAGEL
jgi:DNA polymerase III epsilon subunit-like protein